MTMMLAENTLAWATRYERRLVLALCVLVFLAGVANALARGHTLPYLDERDYHAIAGSLAAGRGFSLEGRPTAWRPPGYPLLLAVPIMAGATIPHLRILNAGLLALTIYLIHALVRTQAPAPAGLAAAIMTACFPVLLYTAGTLFPQTLGGVLLVAIMLLLARRLSRRRETVAAGLLFGALILTIPTFIFQLGVVVLWLVWVRREPLRRVALVVIPALALVAVWALRNYLVLGAFVFVTTNAGLPLLIGNYPGARPDADPAIYLADLAPQMALAETMNEVEADRYFRKQAWAFMSGHPAEALQLYSRKALNYFNYRSEILATGEGTRTRDIVMALTYLPLLAALVLRLLFARTMRFSPMELLLAVLYLTNALFAALFFTKIRYRLPFDLLLIALAALTLFRLAGRWAGVTSMAGMAEVRSHSGELPRDGRFL
jgi:hypothetical protein